MNQRKHYQRNMSAAGMTLAAAMLFAGCGSSTPSTTAAPSSKTSASASKASGNQKLIPVTIAKAVNVVAFTGANVAEKEGFFKQQGIAPTIVTLQGSSAANAALVGGSVQFTMADSIPLAIARTKGVPLLAVEGIDHGDSEQLIVSNQWIKAHHISTSEPLLQRIKALKGMTFAQVGPTDLKLFQMLLQQAGLSSGSVKVVSLGSGTEAATALEHGSIDAFQISPPTSFEVAAQGYGQVLVNYKTVPGQKSIEYDLVMTTTQYAKQNPTIVRKVATALAEANNFMLNHPNQTLKIEEQLFPSISSKVLTDTLSVSSWNKNGLQSSAMWSKADTLINQLGLVKGNNFKAVQGMDWTNQYIDTSALNG